MSLKYTAMRYCSVASWDDDFDLMADKLSSIMNSNELHFGLETYDKTLPEYTIDTYKTAPEWNEIMTLFPGNESEFDRLISKSWGDCFGAIPSNILGKYCCQDAYYTLLIRQKSDELGFSQTAWKCFDDNLRLGAHLNINGALIDQKYNKWMADVGNTFTAYGSLTVAKLYCKLELEVLGKNEHTVPSNLHRILSMGVNPFSSKDILLSLFDPEWESGINEDKAGKYITYDELYYIKGMLSDSDKLPLTKGAFRSRSIFTELDKGLLDYYEISSVQHLDNGAGLISFKDGSKITEDELSDITKSEGYKNSIDKIDKFLEVIDINKPVSTITVDDVTYDISKIEDIAKDIFKYGSSIEIDKLCYRLMLRMQKNMYLVTIDPKKALDDFINNKESDIDIPKDKIDMYIELKNRLLVLQVDFDKMASFLANNKFEDAFEYIKSIGVSIPEEVLDLYNDNTDYIKWSENYVSTSFLNEVLRRAERCISELSKCNNLDNEGLKALSYTEKYNDALGASMDLIDRKQAYLDHKKLYNELNGLFITFDYNKLAKDYFVHYDFEFTYLDMLKAVAGDLDLDKFLVDNVMNMKVEDKTLQGYFKYQFGYMVARKYSKITSTYVSGMLIDTARYCKDYDSNAVSTGRWNSGPIFKAFPRYDVMQKKSKRWSSNFHTIPSGSECKRCVTTPKGYLLSYFDINTLVPSISNN
jgi:hypothetical protein